MRPETFSSQCTARSKQSGCRCRNYACRGRSTCRMHGGTSRRGVDHPRFTHGRFAKDLQGLGQLLKPHPVVVDVVLYPKPLEELIVGPGRKKLRAALRGLRGRIVPSEQLTNGEWMQVLYAARRLLGEELREMRARLAELSAQEAARGATPHGAEDQAGGAARCTGSHQQRGTRPPGSNSTQTAPASSIHPSMTPPPCSRNTPLLNATAAAPLPQSSGTYPVPGLA
jgi:hypothetical protein